MPASAGNGTRRTGGGFTLIELSVVILILGLMLWIAAPRLAAIAEPQRSQVFRDLSAGSEKAFDTALFEKREVRLFIDPRAGTYRFQVGQEARETAPGLLGDRLSFAGIRIDGDDRPLDVVTEVRYLPGGRVPEVRLFVRDSGGGDEPTDWTLRIDPVDGSVTVLEGQVLKDASEGTDA